MFLSSIILLLRYRFPFSAGIVTCLLGIKLKIKEKNILIRTILHIISNLWNIYKCCTSFFEILWYDIIHARAESDFTSRVFRKQEVIYHSKETNERLKYSDYCFSHIGQNVKRHYSPPKRWQCSIKQKQNWHKPNFTVSRVLRISKCGWF